MSQWIDKPRSQNLKEAIDNSFALWKADRANPVVAGSVLTDLCMPFYVKDRGAISPDVVDYALVRLIDYCHLMVEHDVPFAKAQHNRILVLLCTMEGWRVFAREREDYLLAALLLSSPEDHTPQELDGTLPKTVCDWSGCAPDTSRYDWKNDAQRTAVLFREELGRYLFGDTWYALYNDSLTGSFKKAYRALMETMPVFSFKGSAAPSSVNVTVHIPYDF